MWPAAWSAACPTSPPRCGWALPASQVSAGQAGTLWHCDQQFSHLWAWLVLVLCVEFGMDAARAVRASLPSTLHASLPQPMARVS